MTLIEKVQQIELKMLDALIDVLDKHHLKWCSDAGTTLGTIRHGGFIPWDDDIDIMMPRDDYNKLLQIGPFEFTAPYFFQTTLTDSVFCVHAKLRYDGTTAMTKMDCLGTHHRGIFIDIFPLDAIPDDDKVYNNEIGFIRLLGHDANIRFAGAKNHPEVSMLEARRLFITMNEIVTDISHQYSSSKYVTDIVMHRFKKIIGLRYERKDYASFVDFPFKGLKHKMKVPIGYDNVLTAQYGDWRTERHEDAIHGSTFFDVDNDYSKYDGLSLEELNKLKGEK